MYVLTRCDFIQAIEWMGNSEHRHEPGSRNKLMKNDFPVLCINLLILAHRWDED